MRYVEGLDSVEGGYNRTGSRSPMQWDDGVNAGFSCAGKEKLYIPLDESTDRPTVQNQMADSSSLYHEVKRLIALRQAHPALQSKGEIDFIYAEKNAYPFAYLRSAGNEKILVILNPSDRDTAFDCDYSLENELYAFGGKMSAAEGKITVPAQSYAFYQVS